jgi:hypothetical protein
LCWTKLRWEIFFSQYFGFPLSLSFHQWCILVFVYCTYARRIN